jgi:hypothetical protein
VVTSGEAPDKSIRPFPEHDEADSGTIWSEDFLMKYWHRFQVWLLGRRIRREHHELAKYVRRSAYEIAAWQQDIGFLKEIKAYHEARCGRPSGEPPSEGKVVPMPRVEIRPHSAFHPAAHMG